MWRENRTYYLVWNVPASISSKISTCLFENNLSMLINSFALLMKRSLLSNEFFALSAFLMESFSWETALFRREKLDGRKAIQLSHHWSFSACKLTISLYEQCRPRKFLTFLIRPRKWNLRQQESRNSWQEFLCFFSLFFAGGSLYSLPAQSL